MKKQRITFRTLVVAIIYDIAREVFGAYVASFIASILWRLTRSSM